MTFRLKRFRRFEDESELDVSSSVVAIVGPNEAGKSTILDAMVSFDSDTDFDRQERTRETTRGTALRAGYVLDDTDRGALADIPGGSDVRWWTLEKQDGGRCVYQLVPRPMRDLAPRHQTAATLKSFADQENIKRFGSANKVDIASAFEQTMAALSINEQDLASGEVLSVRQFAGAMLAFPSVCNPPAPVDTHHRITPEFCEFLRGLAKYDEGPGPLQQAAKRLMEQRPKFLLFGEADRSLASRYDLMQVIGNRPPAFENLVRLAKLDPGELLEAITTDDGGRRLQLLRRANAELHRVFDGAWRQSSVTVYLETQGTVLEVYATLPEGAFAKIEERSAGLLSFVALRAFLARQDSSVPPIVLIDEAETHLHYDAQADLTKVFAEQRLADKIIYTTHSAACLPQDLGNGIQVASPIREMERSTIKKSIWDGDAAGFSPLIYAMGATTFAFLPARWVVIVEGPSDAILYPTLFREATGVPSLPFQVAPGLAAANEARMLGLPMEGGSVAFITDGDDAGRGYRAQLAELGVPERISFGLDGAIGQGFQIEDLIDPDLYCAAVNDILRAFQQLTDECQPQDVTSPGRANALRTWCDAQGIKPPDKTKLAQRLLDFKFAAARRDEECRLLSGDFKDAIATLYSAILTALQPSLRAS